MAAFGNVQIADITYGGTNEHVVWRSPITDFPNGSKLTVGETQEAVFYYNGACVGVLGAGSHILETEYIPFLKALIQKITGTTSLFHAQVYFVNKVVVDTKWGAGDIVYEDPAGPVFNIGCRGQINLQACNARQIIEKRVGGEQALTKTQVAEFFKDRVAAEVRDCLVNTMLENEISITRVSASLGKIQQLLAPRMSQAFEQYGFSVEDFIIGGVHVPEDDPEYQRLKRLRSNQGMRMSELQLEQQEELIRMQTEAQKTRMQAEAQAYSRQVQGYDYATERQFDFLNNIANNQNAGAGISSDMLQMGAGLGMIGTVSGMMQNMTSPFTNSVGAMTSMPGAGVGQSQVGADAVSTAEATDVGEPTPTPQAEDPVAVLGKLKQLLDAGLIEQAEFDAKKAEILSRM